MFSRRKRASSQPARGPHTGPPKATAASTAAAQAFLANRASNGDLSSAAAAAALRSLTSSPTPVGEIQTKRMQRRGSQSSNTSAPPGPGLRRQNSSGSMTERTFRNPSPSQVQTDFYGNEAPPLPEVPKAYSSDAQMSTQHRRSASTQAPAARFSSPPPRVPAGRGVSLDRGPGVMTPKLKSTKRTPGQAEYIETPSPQDGRRSSVNFSRPMSPAAIAQAERANGTAQPRSNANTAANIAVLNSAERQNVEHGVQDAASAPVKKKKKAAAPSSEGSHLAAGTSGPRLTGTAVDNGNGVSGSTAPAASAQKAPVSRPAARFVDEYDSEASDMSDRPQTQAPRGRGALTKQPSIVKEDIEAEEEEELRVISPPSATKGQNGAAKAVSAPKPNTGSKIVSKADTLSPTRDTRAYHNETQQLKRDSLSPARQAHFSAQPILETPLATKHQPLGRSVSPAKSALKHSPSPRGPSPNGAVQGWNKPGHTPSEISDEASLASDDGLRTRRKKSVRVSFDDDPVIVGLSAQPDTPASPILSSPQDKKPRTWFGFGKDKKQHPQPVLEETDDVMQPIPALPSFGSIRGPKKSQQSGERETSPPTENAVEHYTNPAHSNDHAVGGILAHDHEQKYPAPTASNDPLPPEVTTVEGSGYHSDTESSIAPSEEFNNQDTHAFEPLPSIEPGQQLESPNDHRHVSTEAGDNENPIARSSEEANLSAISEEDDASQKSSLPVLERPAVQVPEISVLPATPGRDAMDENDGDNWFGMPGGFPENESSAKYNVADSGPIPFIPIDETRPSEVGIAEPEPREAAVQHDPQTPVVGHVSDSLRQQTAIPEEEDDDEDTDSGNSIYSDAEEDLSDAEGDGFGSINAIVESPLPREKKGKGPAVPPPSPPPKSRARPQVANEDVNSVEPANNDGWDKAQSYWSSLSSTRKAELEQAALTPSPAERSVPQTTAAEPTSRPKKKKILKQPSTANGTLAASEPTKPAPKVQAARPVREPTSEPITKTAAKKPSLKKSMRDGQTATAPAQDKPVASMRASMRDGAPRGLGTTRESVRHKPSNSITGMPVPEPRGALQKKHRPMSSAGVPQSAAAAGGAMRNRPASIAAPSSSAIALAQAKASAPPVPALNRQTSNGSDSDSSFRRARRNRAQNDSGRYSMRHSMRGSSVAERPRSSFNPDPPRRESKAFSVRSASPGGNAQRSAPMRTSLRSASQAPERTKSPSRSIFGRKSKAPPAPEPKSSSKAAPRFRSRFNDSSDEEDNVPMTFRSRFADSDSEDDEPAPLDLTPVRGIPRRVDEGDSTDLEDSDEERKSKKKAQQPPPLTIPKTNAEGSTLANGSLRRSGSGRDAMSPTREEKKKRSFFGTLGRRKDKTNKVGKVDFESAARRDTSLERSKAERNALRNVDETPPNGVATVESPTASPKSPKLQRRNPQRIGSDSWPLPPPIPESPSAPVRPNTSDGTKSTTRPELGARGFSAVSASTGKKKRFPMLRKAFGLHD